MPHRITSLFAAFVAIGAACSEASTANEAGAADETVPPDSIAEAASIHFENVAEVAGLRFEHRSSDPTAKRCIMDTIGSGIAVADFDGDEHLDVYFANCGPNPGQSWPKPPCRLFLGDGRGGFRPGNPGEAAESAGYAIGVAAADFDRDGDMDIYVCRLGPNRLLRNRGDGTFEDVAEALGVAHPGAASSAAWGDFDGDGRLDLFVCNYITYDFPASNARNGCTWAGIPAGCGPKEEKTAPNVLFLQREDGTFEDATINAGMGADRGRYSLAVVAGDLDGDFDCDLYVANDSLPNAFWKNDGTGRFADVGLINGTALSTEGMSQAGMGVVAEDLSGDGVLDIVVTNFARDTNAYYRGRKDGTFDEISHASGLGRTTWNNLAFGCNGEDFDSDGRIDLFFANGHVFPEVDSHPLDTTYAQKNQVFRNLGDGRFADVSENSGPAFQGVGVGRGSVAADFDADGRVDVLISNLDGKPELYMNRTPTTGNWIKVRARSEPGVADRTCVGAVVSVTAEGRVIRREIRAGISYASSSADDLHFGLGEAKVVDEVTIRYPGGATEARRGVPVNARVDFRRTK